MNEQVVIDRLNKAGYEAFFVGGCVRDKLLGRPIHDVDITTSASPQQVLSVFKDFKTILTGVKHGTVGVVINKKIVEITTYRVDGEYENHRKPQNVEFTTSLKEDLVRRDFTMNALAYNQQEGLVDLVNGQKDIEARLIRCVGDPYKRFEEDALRIMRALRFKSQLGFDIEEKTHHAIMDKYQLLDNVAIERINQELSQLMVGDYVDSILLQYSHILEFILKQPINNTVVLSQLGKSFEVRMATILTSADITHLRYDKKRTNLIQFLIENKKREIGDNLSSFLKTLSEFGMRYTLKLAEFQQKDVSQYIFEVNDKKLVYQISDLAINGNQLIKMGFIQGPQIKVLLQLILEAVIDNKIENNMESIQNWLLKQ